MKLRRALCWSTVLASSIWTGCVAESVDSEEEIVQMEDAIVALNALSINSLTQNSLTQNALTANSLTQNSLTQNSLTQNSLVMSALASAQSREFLRYVVGCALNAGQTI